MLFSFICSKINLGAMEEQATITVRIIKSFEYKNFRTLIFTNVNLHELDLNKLCDLVWERAPLDLP